MYRFGIGFRVRETIPNVGCLIPLMPSIFGEAQKPLDQSKDSRSRITCSAVGTWRFAEGSEAASIGRKLEISMICVLVLMSI